MLQRAKYIIAVVLSFIPSCYFCEAKEDAGDKIVLRRGNGATVARQMSLPNTTYIVKYNYNLRGRAISIPDGCTLEFKGGGFCNGTILFSETEIRGSNTQDVFSNIQTKGTIRGDCYGQWFRDGSNLQTLLNIAGKRVFLKEKHIYRLEDKLIVDKPKIELNGNGSTILFCADGIRLSANGKDSLKIYNVTIDGDNRTNSGLAFYRCNNIELKKVKIKNIAWDKNKAKTYCYGVEFVACNGIAIDSCVIEDVKATPTSNVAGGIAVNVSDFGETSKNITIKNSKVGRIWSQNNGVGLGADCIVLSGRYNKDKDINAVIKNCEFYDFTKRGIKGQAENVTVEGCTFYLTPFMKDKDYPRYIIEVFGNNSTVINNLIDLKGRKCLIGIGVYAAGKSSIKNGAVCFDEREITQNVTITNNFINADTLSYGIQIGIAGRDDYNLYKQIKIKNNTFTVRNSFDYGIRTLDALVESEISGNVIEKASQAIFLSSPAKVYVDDGVTMSYHPHHKHVVIKNNVINGGDYHQHRGIAFDLVSDSHILQNQIDNYTNGILFGTEEKGLAICNCSIERNKISRSTWGIETKSNSRDIRIVDNYFSESKYSDMVLGEGGKNFYLERNVAPKKIINATK